MIDVIANKKEFLKIVKTHIKRKGIKELLEWLEGTDFFEAPASSVYHLNEKGGLCQHTLNVYARLHKILENEYGPEYDKVFGDMETLAIVALFHDVCKADFYVEELRNVKINGNWEQVPFYKVKEKFHFGHGAKSVYIVQSFMEIFLDEATAIRYHMGGMEYPNANFIEPNITEVYNDYPLTLYLHMADLQASYIDERIVKENE